MKRISDKFFFLLYRVVLPSLINFFWRFVPRYKNTLLIIKNDGIGDYILFRNYLSCIKGSERYKNHHIYFLGNLSSKALAEQFDRQTVDGFFWYADGYFLKWRLIALLWKLQFLRIETIAYVNYSRTFSTDWLISNIAATNKYGFRGDLVNQTASHQILGNLYYTSLFEPGLPAVHEFYRNRNFIEQLIQEPCAIKKPYIDKSTFPAFSHNQVCIFLGGSTANKKWPITKLTALCRSILDHSDLEIIITGGPDDVDDAESITVSDKTRVKNTVGKTTLLDLCSIIGASQILISNDSAALHIGVALNVPVVGMAKGDLYGRFVPYPAEITDKIEVIFPDSLDPLPEGYYWWADTNISDIEPDTVFNAVKNMLEQHAPVISHATSQP